MTIGGAIQNRFPSHWAQELHHVAAADASAVSALRRNSSIVGLAGAVQAGLPPGIQLPVRTAFAGAFRILYYSGIPLLVSCLLPVLWMKRMALRDALHTAYGVEEREHQEE